jgi:hypothetical protein
VSKLKLPWGEELHIETDVEQFTLDVMHLVAEYYVEAELLVVRSIDFTLDDDMFVVRSCTVNFSPAFPDEFDDGTFEKKWEDFMLIDPEGTP